MIVKNEQEVLARCLSSVKPFADEIIVVDTGSSDKTVSVAGQFTDKIFTFEWCDDFSAARNFSFSKATCDLIMWLDADDVVREDDAKKIEALKEQMHGYDVAFLLYAAGFEGERPTLTYFRERIFRRGGGFVWKGAVHEAVEAHGRVLYSDAKICHKKERAGDKWRNLNIYRKLISNGGRLAPRDKFYYGRELMFCGLYREAAAILVDFLNGEGWEENKCEACLNLCSVYCALGDRSSALAWALKSFEYGVPKSRACCMIGEEMALRGKTDAAIYWYKTAASLPQNIYSGAFVEEDYSGYIPYLQLCVLYDRLGNYTVAERYNELAGSIKPHSAAYLANKSYFLSRRRGGAEDG